MERSALRERQVSVIRGIFASEARLRRVVVLASIRQEKNRKTEMDNAVEEASGREICRHWIRLRGFCNWGDKCKYAHPKSIKFYRQPVEQASGPQKGVPLGAKKFSAMRAARVRAAELSADPTDLSLLRRQWYGRHKEPEDGVRKIKKYRPRNQHRASAFCRWILDMYGAEALRSGSGVVDVAGGSGRLSCQLMLAHVPSLIVDPRPPNWKRSLTRVRCGVVLRNALVARLEAVEKASASGGYKRDLEGFLVELENATYGPYGTLRSARVPKSLQSPFPLTFPIRECKKVHSSSPDALYRALADCSLVVGLHCDQPTESIVDFGLRTGTPIAVVPCCVFAKEFPGRFVKDPGTGQVRPVSTYDDLCAYLLAKSPRLQSAKLDFPGRNVVIYLPFQPEKKSTQPSLDPPLVCLPCANQDARD